MFNVKTVQYTLRVHSNMALWHADPVEVADTILYLLSDRASAVTGELVLCDAGRLAAC